MRWLDAIWKRKSWTWVGAVHGHCNWKDGSVSIVIWNLFIREDGKRRADVVGNKSYVSSGEITWKRAQVKAWLKGAPLPKLSVIRHVDTPKPNLIAFPGGKGDAA